MGCPGQYGKAVRGQAPPPRVTRLGGYGSPLAWAPGKGPLAAAVTQRMGPGGRDRERKAK